MNKIPINLGYHKYNIFIKEDIFDYIVNFHKKNFANCKAFIITDNNVKKLYSKKLIKSFDKEKVANYEFSVSPGEKSKNFKTLESLTNKTLSKRITREDIIYALGGGIVGDLAGFLASIILRGVKFVQVPTTLLSQVDSSVGGKTGINSKSGKNLVGSFYQPSAVFIDPLMLRTLPKKEFLAGYAEVIKYSLIDDKKFFMWLDKNLDKTIRLDLSVIKKIITICCRKKSHIVKLDAKEKNIRVLLNLGHTFAHAIEAELKYSIRHGEAVSIGLLMAMELSRLLKLSTENDVKLLEKHIKKSRLPFKLRKLSKKHKWNTNNLINKMHNDKKINKGEIRFILCKGIGKTQIQEKVKKFFIKKSIEKFI